MSSVCASAVAMSPDLAAGVPWLHAARRLQRFAVASRRKRVGDLVSWAQAMQSDLAGAPPAAVDRIVRESGAEVVRDPRIIAALRSRSPLARPPALVVDPATLRSWEQITAQSDDGLELLLLALRSGLLVASAGSRAISSEEWQEVGVERLQARLELPLGEAVLLPPFGAVLVDTPAHRFDAAVVASGSALPEVFRKLVLRDFDVREACLSEDLDWLPGEAVSAVVAGDIPAGTWPVIASCRKIERLLGVERAARAPEPANATAVRPLAFVLASVCSAFFKAFASGRLLAHGYRDGGSPVTSETVPAWIWGDPATRIDVAAATILGPGNLVWRSVRVNPAVKSRQERVVQEGAFLQQGANQAVERRANKRLDATEMFEIRRMALKLIITKYNEFSLNKLHEQALAYLKERGKQFTASGLALGENLVRVCGPNFIAQLPYGGGALVGYKARKSVQPKEDTPFVDAFLCAALAAAREIYKSPGLQWGLGEIQRCALEAGEQAGLGKIPRRVAKSKVAMDRVIKLFGPEVAEPLPFASLLGGRPQQASAAIAEPQQSPA